MRLNVSYCGRMRAQMRGVRARGATVIFFLLRESPLRSACAVEWGVDEHELAESDDAIDARPYRCTLCSARPRMEGGSHLRSKAAWRPQSQVQAQVQSPTRFHKIQAAYVLSGGEGAARGATTGTIGNSSHDPHFAEGSFRNNWDKYKLLGYASAC